ncbi:MAG: heavy-metal-associated domain-containing protein [Clostridia bacterium]|nr:heavy-metal-associated domain-containing protein [Clostridia bacterium]
MFGFGKKITHTFAVNGMSCSHCTARVEKALTEIKGVKSAKADLEAKTVTVTAADSVSLNALKAAVNALGFEA